MLAEGYVVSRVFLGLGGMLFLLSGLVFIVVGVAKFCRKRWTFSDIPWTAVGLQMVMLNVLTFIGWLFVREMSGKGAPALVDMDLMTSNLIFPPIGFCLAGCITPMSRMRHLFILAFVVWLTQLVTLSERVSVWQWFAGIFFLCGAALIGGAMSFLFVKQSAVEATGT